MNNSNKGSINLTQQHLKMRNYFLLTPTFIILTIVIFGIACKGQVKKDLAKDEISESQIIPAGKPKLIKTQGSQPSDNVNCSLQDKNGNLWFGTTGEGVYRYDGKSFIQSTEKDGLNSNVIYSILEDKDGKLWIGTLEGLCVYDGKTFTKIQIPLPENLPPNKHHTTHDVFSIMQDKSGKLWFATIDGVFIYDGKSFTHFVVNNAGVGFKSSNNNVEYILEDKEGNIWFGGRTNDGVFRYDGKSISNLKLLDLKGNAWAWPALQDKNGNIWFSNWGGAYRYDGKSFKGFTTDNGLCNDGVTRIIEDKNGNLWFGGGNGGICRFDGTSFTSFTTKEGLINNDVWSILEDKSGILWIGTRNTGLCSFDGKTFTHYSE
jgi:ligand-binding sensor domain-containing protein